MHRSDSTGRVWVLVGPLVLLLLTAGQCGGAINTRPTAHAGSDQTVTVGDLVTLDGEASNDSDGDAVAFDWSFQSVPTGSAASLSTADTAAPTFTADVAGGYVVRLSVSDGELDAVDTVTVAASGAANDPPSFDAQSKLAADDAAAGDSFGASVAISGDHAIIGAPEESGTGSAYMFSRTGDEWVQSMKLPAARIGGVSRAHTVSAGDAFGTSVAISGNYAIVGAYRDDDGGPNAGAAYVYERCDATVAVCDRPWHEVDTLTASDAAGGDLFGLSVSIDGDYAIVGAPGDDLAGTNAGSAYVYKRSGEDWLQVDTLTASDAAEDHSFGSSVAVDGDLAIVGMFRDDLAGSAYIFKRVGEDWAETNKLAASDAAEGDSFGFSVAIDGGYAVVGAFFDDLTEADEGSAYVFHRSGDDWLEIDKLVASDAAADDRFGISVAVRGNYAIVGAYQDDLVGLQEGSAYVFRRTGEDWAELTKLTASDAAAGDFFGGAVAINGAYAVVGAVFDDLAGTDEGSAYVFLK